MQRRQPKMSKMAQAVALIIACRDEWHRQNPEETVRNKLFGSFKKWLVSLEETRRSSSTVTPMPSPVRQLFSLLFGGNDTNNYALSSFKAKFNNQAMEFYRIAFAADFRDGETDERVRSLILFLCNKPELRFAFTTLLTPFFTASPFNPSKPPIRAQRSVFRTNYSTRFEQMLYITALAHALNSRPSIPKLSTVGRMEAQRIGKAVQIITRGWDVFSAFLGFRSIEDLSFSYLTIDASELKYKVVESRNTGFVPSSRKSSLNIPPKLSNSKDDIDTIPFALNEETDKHIRTFLHDFLSDIYGSVEQSSLYTAPEEEPYPPFENFKPLNVQNEGPSGSSESPYSQLGRLPNRFQNLSVNMTLTIKMAVSTIQGGVSHQVLTGGQDELPLRRRPSDSDISLQPKRKRRKVVPSRSRTLPALEGESLNSTGLAPLLASSTTPVDSGLRRRSLARLLETRKTPAFEGSGQATQSGSDSSLQTAGNKDELLEAFKTLESEMESQCVIMDIEFEKFSEELELLFAEAKVLGNTQFICIEPPYNKLNADHEKLSYKQMRKVVRLIGRLLRPGGHAIILCPFSEASTWIELCQTSGKNSANSDEDESDDDEDDDDESEESDDSDDSASRSNPNRSLLASIF
ncbi:hypothetical protein FGB62_382g04 [Gracilaria domingensis]|nr:hypothetical protein FGB62_382g012 [Gracilaria domingensis]KAI0556875.1 hypothetical protein FGB62_382g011 [Gracilaria domingensis]KAI0556876.1 hypothetical protein FGB62_382g04 [Gracilaria domingensis]